MIVILVVVIIIDISTVFVHFLERLIVKMSRHISQKHSVSRRARLTLLVIANHKVSWLCKRGIDWCCRNQNSQVGYRNCSSNIGSRDKLHISKKREIEFEQWLALMLLRRENKSGTRC